MQIGDKVWWAHTPRGGWGFAQRIYAVIIGGVGKKKARIAVYSEVTNGIKRRTVDWSSLTPRESAHPLDTLVQDTKEIT